MNNVRALHEYMKLHQWIHFRVDTRGGDTLALTDDYRYCPGCRLLHWKDSTCMETRWTSVISVPEDPYWEAMKKAAKEAGIDLRSFKRPHEEE